MSVQSGQPPKAARLNDLLGVGSLHFKQGIWLVLKMKGHDDPAYIKKDSIREPSAYLVE